MCTQASGAHGTDAQRASVFSFVRRARCSSPYPTSARAARWFACLWLAPFAILPSSAWALVTGELADKIADVLAIVVIVVVPIVGIYVFWKVHIIPEHIAEKRQHPQKDAIRVLCLLSLVFGGMLWPIAWLWAYTKPTLHKLAYGTDKHEDAEKPVTEKPVVVERQPRIAALNMRLEDHLAVLRSDIERLSDEGAAPEDVAALRRDVARIEKKLAPTARPGAH